MGVISAEVEIDVPVSRAWEIYRNNDLMMKVNPELFSRVEYLQGDGCPGSIRLLKLGPNVGTYVNESKEEIQKVEERDNGWKLLSYRVIDSELRKIYDPYTATFCFRPASGNENRCLASWRAQYEPVSASVSAPDKARNAALKFLMSIEDFHLRTSASASTSTRMPICN